jgi:hypothetical protein
MTTTMESAGMNYRRADDTEAFSRNEIVEQEALAFHESDHHAQPFAACSLGCWQAAEAAFDDALAAGELVPVEAA